jgi:hypothetical protein
MDIDATRITPRSADVAELERDWRQLQVAQKSPTLADPAEMFVKHRGIFCGKWMLNVATDCFDDVWYNL